MSCDFCEESEQKLIRKIKDDGVLKASGYTFLKGNNLVYRFIFGDIMCQSVSDSYEIKYCPYCGQNLEELYEDNENE